MGDFSVLGIKIKELRASLNMTQKDFAAHVGCTAATLSAYENGSKSPSLEIVKAIAEKCHVSIDWLCGLSDKKTNDNTPQTYADIIDLLVELEHDLELTVSSMDIGRIDIEDTVIQCFMSEWVQMVELYRNGTIDHKLYTLWLDDKKEKYDVELFDHDDIASFLDQLAYDKS